MIERNDREFWNERYRNSQTGWDIGYVSAPIKEYFDKVKDKKLEMLIPGAGNAWEAEYLFHEGFQNVVVLDISDKAMESFKKRVPEFPVENLITGDFYRHEGQYDIIVEQTFFCALPKKYRSDYAKKMRELLKPGGRLVGVLFNIPLNEDNPPYGGSKEEYIPYFEGLFEMKKFEECYNSVPPRSGSELFIELVNPE